MDPDELAARRIADRGRGALMDQLRVVFSETAASHSELIQLDAGQLERMVHAAADRADGVLWRRALAGVAVDELEISLGEAVEHPAVLRATDLLGVPAYETGRTAAVPEPERTPEPEPERAPEPEAEPELEHTPEPEPTQPTEPAARVEPPSGGPASPELQAIRIAAVHLAGIETLREGARNIELRFSDAGLDVMSTHDGESIGRLGWDEIRDLELPRQRRALRRRKTNGPELIVRTDRGQARFELPSLSDEEAREHLAPVLRRARGAVTSE